VGRRARLDVTVTAGNRGTLGNCGPGRNYQSAHGWRPVRRSDRPTSRPTPRFSGAHHGRAHGRSLPPREIPTGVLGPWMTPGDSAHAARWVPLSRLGRPSPRLSGNRCVLAVVLVRRGAPGGRFRRRARLRGATT